MLETLHKLITKLKKVQRAGREPPL